MCICVVKIDKGVRGVKSETIWGLFLETEGSSMVGLVASAAGARWLVVTGVWCICEFKIDKGGERGKVRDDLGAVWQAERGSVGNIQRAGTNVEVIKRVAWRR